MKKILLLICLTINLVCFSATKSIVYNSLKYTIDTTKLTAILTGPENNNPLYDLNIPDFVIDNNIQYAVTSIAEEAFQNTNVINGTLTLGQNIKIIGYNAFEKCNIQGTLIIPNSVTSIGCMAFYDCSGITTLVIGKGVEEIGEMLKNLNYNQNAGWAFGGCYRLEYIICLASKAPNTWNNGFYQPTGEHANFPFYNVKLYVPAAFSGTGSCSFDRNAWYKSTGEWSKFVNKYVLEDSEFAGFLDGTYGKYEGNGDNPGSDLEEGQYVSLYLNKGETRDLGNLLGVISGGGPSGGEDERPIASTWSSSDESIVQVSKYGKCTTVDFGTAIITAYDADGEKLGSIKIFVSPSIGVEYSDGRIYKHNVVYNSHPTLYFEILEGYKIVRVEHDGENVTEIVFSNNGVYSPTSPITADSTISVSLISTKDPADLNGDGVVNVVDMNILIERMLNY